MSATALVMGLFVLIVMALFVGWLIRKLSEPWDVEARDHENVALEGGGNDSGYESSDRNLG